MEAALDIQKRLIELSPAFSSAAIETLKGLFGQEAELHMPWEVVEQLQAQFDRILTMGSANTEFTAITCAGMQFDSMNAFVGQDDISNEMAADVLGEFVNTYCALLADNEEFRSSFGVLVQGVPVLYTHGQSFLPFIWGIQGYLYIGEHWMYVGFSLRALPPQETLKSAAPCFSAPQKFK